MSLLLKRPRGHQFFPSLKYFELLPTLESAHPALQQHLIPIVAACIENGAAAVHCNTSQFQRLVTAGVPPDCLSPFVETEEDIHTIAEACSSSQEGLQRQTPLTAQTLHMAFPSSELGAKKLFNFKCWEHAKEVQTPLLLDLIDSGAAVNGIVKGGLTCVVDGGVPMVERTVDEVKRLVSHGVSDVLVEDGRGQCTSRMVENFVKTSAAAGISPDSVGLILRSTVRSTTGERDTVLASNAIATAVRYGITKFGVVTGGAGKPRVGDGVLCLTELLHVVLTLFDSSTRQEEAAEEALALLSRAERLAEAIRRPLAPPTTTPTDASAPDDDDDGDGEAPDGV